MPDLFARLAARSRGQATSLRPRPGWIYTGPSMVISSDNAPPPPVTGPPDATGSLVNPANSPLIVDATENAANPSRTLDAADGAPNRANSALAIVPTDRFDTAEPTEGRESVAWSDPEQRPPTPGEGHDEWQPAISPPMRPAHPPPDPPASRTPTAKTRYAAPSGDLRERGTARNAPAAGALTLAQVVAALDAGSPVVTPARESPSHEAQPPAVVMGPARPDHGVHDHDVARRGGGHDVHVTIGELVIRGHPAAPPAPATSTAVPSPPARRLTLHDYLRGRREPT